MLIQMACTVNELVARRLGVEIDLARWRDELRRGAHPTSSLPSFADLVIDVGGRLDLAYLRREVNRAAFDTMITTEALPAVFLTELDAGEVHATVALHWDGRRAEVVSLRPGGPPVNEPASLDELWLRLAGSRASIPVLLPVLVRPIVGGIDPGEVKPRTPGERLLQLLVAERSNIGLVYLYATLTGLFSLMLPLAVQMLVGLVLGGLVLQPVILIIAFVVAGTLVSGILQVMQLSVVELIQQRVFARMALEFGFKVPRVRLEAVAGTNLPEMMNRFFEIITIQKSLAKLLTEATTALLQIVFGLVLLTFYNPYFTVFSAVLLLGLYLIFRVTGPKGLETSLKESTYKYRTAHWLRDMAEAITAFKFSGRSNLPIHGTDDEVSKYLTYRKKHFGVLMQQAFSMVAFKTAITGGLLILGTLLVFNRQITLGQFVASEIVIVTVLAGVEKLVFSISTVYDILTAVEKAGQVSDLPIEVPGGLQLEVEDDSPGLAVEARRLTYVYPGNLTPTLRSINLRLAPGERVAIVGFDGSGQSTLLRALTGLLDSYEGSVTYNGLTLRDLDRMDLRGRIGQFLSVTDLFDGTIEENVSVGRNHVRAPEVMRALELVGADEYVQALPKGLGTEISAAGKQLPVGIALKLLLAQAIAGRPKFLVLEDVFQNLERAGRREIVRMLTDPAAGWTLLVATHDPALLAACDRIYMLQDGAIVREGRFAELLSDPLMQSLVPEPLVSAMTAEGRT